MKFAPLLALALLVVPAVQAQETVKLEMPAADVRDVLQFYGRIAKKRIIFDATIQGQLNVVAPNPLSREQAGLMIEQTLLLNGYCLIDRGPDAVVVLGISKNPRQGGVPIVTRPEDIPSQERIITYVLRLKHRDPTEVQQMLQQYVPAQTFTSFIADPRAKLLIVTESISVVRRVLDLMKEVDVPVSPVKAAPSSKAGSAPPRR